MRTRDTTEVQAGKPERARRTSNSRPVEDLLLGLQQSAGNSAVANLLVQRMNHDKPASGEKRRRSQRKSGEPREPAEDKKRKVDECAAPGDKESTGGPTYTFAPRQEGEQEGYFNAIELFSKPYTVDNLAFRVTLSASKINVECKKVGEHSYAAAKKHEVVELLRAVGKEVKDCNGAFCKAGRERSAFAVFAAYYVDGLSKDDAKKKVVCAAAGSTKQTRERLSGEWFTSLPDNCPSKPTSDKQ